VFTLLRTAVTSSQLEVDRANRVFWDELCGSGFAQRLGIRDHSPESLRRFDEAYFRFYPYLLKHVPVWKMRHSRVLEVGLGYGSLGQRIAEAGAFYVGLDIAEAPVRLMNCRLKMLGQQETAIQRSFFNHPFKAEMFDWVVSIGCFHHTGDIPRCIRETHYVLKHGGRAVIMLYNGLSYLHWLKWPLSTFRHLLCGSPCSASEKMRSAFDRDMSGQAAPETQFSSIRQLRRLFAPFSQVRFSKTNCGSLSLFQGSIRISRAALLPTLGRILGTDIYLEAVK